VHFALDYNRAADELFYDLRKMVRVHETQVTTCTMDPAWSKIVPLRDIPLIRSMLDLDSNAITKTIEMTMVGGTYDRGSGFSYDLAGEYPSVPNLWQPPISNIAQKTAIFIAAAGIGYRF